MNYYQSQFNILSKIETKCSQFEFFIILQNFLSYEMLFELKLISKIAMNNDMRHECRLPCQHFNITKCFLSNTLNLKRFWNAIKGDIKRVMFARIESET